MGSRLFICVTGGSEAVTSDPWNTHTKPQTQQKPHLAMWAALCHHLCS
jgi:hypothetical protein